MVLDPKYFLLHKPPFDKVDLKLKYSLASKIQEEEEKIKIYEKKRNENKKNFIFNQKKEIKFIHVPKNRIKKKTENRILKIFKEENNNSR